MSGWVHDKSRLTRLAREIDSAARITTKDGWFWRALAWLLQPLIAREKFLNDFATTIGPLQGYPRHWPIDFVERALVHESRHTRQARWFSLGIHPWAGLPIMGIMYILLPIPIGLAWIRYRLELDADRASWRHQLRRGATAAEIMLRAARFATIVASRKYGWSVPGRWARWGFKRAAKRLIDAES
jgi:hypothetical protein